MINGVTYTFQGTEINDLYLDIDSNVDHQLYGDTSKVIGFELVISPKKLAQQLAEVGAVIMTCGHFIPGMRKAIKTKSHYQALKKFYPELLKNFLNSIGCKYKNFPQVQRFLLGLTEEKVQSFKSMFKEVQVTQKVKGAKKLEDGSIIADSPEELLRAILGDM